MLKAVKYRAYPNKEQETFFAKTFGCTRLVYNLMLDEAIKSYTETKTFNRHTPAYFKDEYEFLKEVDSLALSNARLNLNSAFRNRFSKKSKKQSGFLNLSLRNTNNLTRRIIKVKQLKLKILRLNYLN